MKNSLLCVDTSTKTGSLALFDISDDQLQLLSDVKWEKAKSHSEIITTDCLKLFSSAKRELSSLHALVTTIGPGSFTGIRVGLNFVKTLSYAQNLPVYTFDALTPLAYSKKSSEHPILVINNAHKNMVYTTIYDSSFSQVLAPCALTLEQLQSHLVEEKYLCLGDAYSVYEKSFSTELKSRLLPEKVFIDGSVAQTLGQMWKNFNQNTRPSSWNQVQPLYIRSSEAEEKLWSGLLRPQVRQ